MTEVDVQSPEEFQREILDAEEPTVVVFWASWCPYCRAFKPHFDAKASESGVRFAVVHLEDDDNPLWEAYRVDVVPSLAYFRDGALAARKDGRLGRGLAPTELDAFLHQVLTA